MVSGQSHDYTWGSEYREDEDFSSSFWGVSYEDVSREGGTPTEWYEEAVHTGSGKRVLVEKVGT